MYKNKRIIGLIPARGGSKGLVHKNIRKLAGKPLIAWTIEQARASKYLDNVLVSSDDSNIIRIAKQYGVYVPFIRPKELATDKAKMNDVILHAIHWLEAKGEYYDLLLLLQPTSPMRLTEDIDDAIKLLFLKKAQTVISVCKEKCNIYSINTLPKDGCMKNFISKRIMNKNRQELPQYYRLNGVLYLTGIDYFKKYKTLTGPSTYAYIMPIERSVDIDTEIDFRYAEFLMQYKGKI